jgi:hypothetical protein
MKSQHDHHAVPGLHPSLLTVQGGPRMINRKFYLVSGEVSRLGNNENSKFDSVRRIELPLVAGEAQLILEALAELDAKWAHICDTSQNDDEIADYGNDLITLRLLADKVKEAAVPVFGVGVTNFSRTPL